MFSWWSGDPQAAYGEHLGLGDGGRQWQRHGDCLGRRGVGHCPNYLAVDDVDQERYLEAYGVNPRGRWRPLSD